MRALTAAAFAAFVIVVWGVGGAVLAETLSTPSFKEDFSGPSGPDGVPVGWKPLEFPKIKKHTIYTVVTEEGAEGPNSYLLAESAASASGLYKEIDVDLRKTPLLRWRWRVDGVLNKGDATRKDGDDYPARVYVTFAFDPATASFFERVKHKAVVFIYGKAPSKAITYIWANKLPKGSAVPNPYTDKAMMVAVESGAGLAGEWVSEERNVYDDYKRYFGGEASGEPTGELPPGSLPKVTSIAVMTDTDNTGGTARAGYDDLEFSR
jgi:hypothetical protein